VGLVDGGKFGCVGFRETNNAWMGVQHISLPFLQVTIAAAAAAATATAAVAPTPQTISSCSFPFLQSNGRILHPVDGATIRSSDAY
jgi:hypothetical protein